jgi:hypothetical protein
MIVSMRKNREIRMHLARWMLIGAAVMALAAAPQRERQPAQPQGPKQPVVTVICKDGKTVRGTLESADPNEVVIKTVPKGEQEKLAWSDITRVSNGLTREKAIEQFKKEHPDDLCKVCGGDGIAPCATCHGTGFDQSKLVKCDQCGGSGVISECTNKKCVDGKVDCPRPCLKLSQGVWKMKDGKRWRDFRGRDGGGLSISENHLGELVEMENGKPVNRGKCPTCGGTTKVDCETCGGMSLITCSKCSFEGKVGPPCPDCKGGEVQCKACGGTGIAAKQ